MNVRVVWSDPGTLHFEWTDAPVGGDVHATFTAAKRSALASARDNRDLWASCVNDILSTTRRDVS